MWNIEDKQGFEICVMNNVGQINIDHDFGKIIYELAADPSNRIFVDIGTWNGLGSTKCFIEAMKKNKSAKLFTIENNSEKFESAKSYWTNTIEEYKIDVRFLNGSLISNDSIDSWLESNNIVLDGQHQYWLEIDKANSVNIVDLNVDSIDILLIDGSEYSGYLELMLLKDISKYIILDDVNSLKNKMSREYLIESDSFDLVKEDLELRNGYSIFLNNSLK